MTIDEILDQLDEMIDRAPGIPLSGGKCIIDTEKVTQLLDDVRINIPSEIKQAKAIVADRSEIIAIARREAENIIKHAEERAKQLVAEEEVVRQAEQRANDIMNDAQRRSSDMLNDAQQRSNDMMNAASEKAKEMKAAANEFANGVLKNSEDVLSASLAEVRNTRSALGKASL